MTKYYSVVTVAVSLILFYSLAPIERVNAVNRPIKRIFNDYGQLCFDLYANKLKDPLTAQIITTAISDTSVVVKYRAENSYGAYSAGYFECPIYNRSFTDKWGQWNRCKIDLIKQENVMTGIESELECQNIGESLKLSKEISNDEFNCYMDSSCKRFAKGLLENNEISEAEYNCFFDAICRAELFKKRPDISQLNEKYKDLTKSF